MQRNVAFLPKDVCKADRYHEEVSNEYLVAKFFFDTAESESSKVCQKVYRQLDISI